MKKLVALLLALLLVLSTGVAFAKDESVETTVSGSAVEIFEGESVNFTAETLKQGKNYSDEWNGADKIDTVKTGDPAVYKSTATRMFDTAGTYTITYSIVMETPGGNRWLASGSVQVVVRKLVVPEITRYEIRNCVQGEAVLNPAGKVIAYKATGELWAIYDNDSENLIRTDHYFELTPNENRNLKEDYTTYEGKPVTLIK